MMGGAAGAPCRPRSRHRRQSARRAAAEIRRAILAARRARSRSATAAGDRRRDRRARLGDVLVIAGKGHETGQIVGSETHPFDDAGNCARLGRVAPGGVGDDRCGRPRDRIATGGSRAAEWAAAGSDRSPRDLVRAIFVALRGPTSTATIFVATALREGRRRGDGRSALLEASAAAPLLRWCQDTRRSARSARRGATAAAPGSLPSPAASAKPEPRRRCLALTVSGSTFAWRAASDHWGAPLSLPACTPDVGLRRLRARVKLCRPDRSHEVVARPHIAW